MKQQIIKRDLRILTLVGFFLAAIAILPVSAQETLGEGYEFGPGLAQTTQDTVSLRVPARTTVGIALTVQRNLTNQNGIPVPNDVNVRIEVFAPNSTTATITQTASATVVTGALQIPTIAIPGVYTSQQGCPGVWRVRISASNGTTPVRIFGTVTFAIVRPGAVNLDMVGDLNLADNMERTAQLSGHGLTGSPDNTLIAGTGTFRIRAKWHTDPTDVLNFGRYFRLTVALLRPNNTVAASENGFSRHAPSDRTPKIDFSYNVTPQDLAMTGTWKIRATRSAGTPKIVGFDIEKDLVDPLAPALASFHSTFSAGCSGAIDAF
jgi:hypothetical protein